MSRLQSIRRRPGGRLTPEVLVRLLAELGETPPRRVPRPYTKTGGVR
jgi:hypothetical protein